MNKIQQIRETLDRYRQQQTCIHHTSKFECKAARQKRTEKENLDHDILIADVEGEIRFIDKALTALSDLEKEQAWQGIETAPRDGTAIVLLYRDLKKVSVGWWSGNEHVGWGNHFANNMNVSHWKPLPAPPEGE